MKLLFTNTGRRTYMVEFAKKIIRSKVLVSDSQNIVPTFYIDGIKKYIMPKVKNNENKYIKKLESLVKKIKIKKIIPLSDHDLIILAENRLKFERFGCDVVISDPSLVKMCMNKKKMYYFCKKNKISTPVSIFSNKEKILSFPLLKKKIFGSGSDGIEEIKNNIKLNKIDFNKFFLQKKIKGTEYGIDIFNDPKNNVSRICIKKKFLMRAGETDRSILVKDKKIQFFANKLIKILNHYGNIDCDVLKDKNGKIFLIDINPRFGGGYPATHLGGMNFLKYILTNGKFKLPKTYKKIIVSKGISLYSKSKIHK